MPAAPMLHSHRLPGVGPRVTALLLALFVTGTASSQERHDGRLEAGDRTLSSGEFYDEYPVALAAGEWVEIDLTSSAFDPYLVLLAPSGADQQNDDHEGSRTRAYLRVQASESGTWRVYVTSFAPGETGAYRLHLNVGDRVACEGCGTPEAAGGAAAPRVERGRLEQGDRTLSSGEFVDEYRVEGRAGEPLVLDLRATGFDPYLILQHPDGEQVDNDDHEGDRTRSLISTALPTTGTYRVFVTSYAAGETGAYDLTIRGGGADGGGTFAAATERRTEGGRLQAGDARLRSGEFYHAYTFEGLPGQRVRLDLRSGAFDPYLVLQPPRGETLKNDDFEGDLTRSRLDYDVSEPGLYRVYVTSYAPGEEGDYELVMDFSGRFGLSEPSGGGTAPATGGFNAGALALDQAASGTLDASDRRLSSGEFVDLHVFDGEAGEPVRIEMTSDAFDTYLIVTTPAGEVIANDDYEGDRTRSVVEMVMPVDGRYRVQATSYAPGETGAYRLRVSQADAMRPDPPAYDRIAGLFIGISDYGGRASDLAYTAADATLIRDALVRGTGMRAEDALVLTDRAATRDAFRAAVHDLAARTDERTLFVLFFSGHGGRYDRTSPQPADPDGLDESIELYDGAILDDELDAILAPLRAGHQLIVLDACFSGGFAKDVITQPGRMGLFSSEEDIVSAVASKFEAGGYLSRFFSDALTTRDADEDGNRALTPLELSEYLRARYAGDVRNTGAEAIVADETRPGHQHLVVDRGSLSPFSTLFLLR